MAPQLNLACPLELSRDPIDLGIKEFPDEYAPSLLWGKENLLGTKQNGAMHSSRPKYSFPSLHISIHLSFNLDGLKKTLFSKIFHQDVDRFATS